MDIVESSHEQGRPSSKLLHTHAHTHTHTHLAIQVQFCVVYFVGYFSPFTIGLFTYVSLYKLILN